MTQFVPIVPTSMLPLTAERPMHMVLAQQMVHDREYDRWYRLEAEKRMRAHIILDNGAYEIGASISDDTLLNIACILVPDELVVPDVLMERKATLERAARFASLFRAWKRARPLEGSLVGLMVVPQGRNELEDLASLRDLMDLFGTLVSCIGLPKHVSRRTTDGYERLHLARQVQVLYPWMPIHFLGADDGLTELRILGADDPYRLRVRSIDSARPITYALNDVALGGPKPPQGEVYKRPFTYFDTVNSPTREFAVKRNIAVVDGWLDGGVVNAVAGSAGHGAA